MELEFALIMPEMDSPLNSASEIIMELPIAKLTFSTNLAMKRAS